MRTNQIYIARDGKSGMHVLVRILAVDDIGKDYLPIDPDDFNKLMMARDVRSLVLAARDLGPMYISADILSRRIFIPSHLRQHIEHGVNLAPSDIESLLSECYFDPYALPVETDDMGYRAIGRTGKKSTRELIDELDFTKAGDRDGMDPRRCAREDLINGVIAEFGSEYIMTGDAGQKNRLNSAEILRFELDSVPTDGNGHITGYYHGFPLGTSLEDISAAIDDVDKVENGHPNRIDIPEKPEDIEMEQNTGVSKEKPPVAEMEDTSIREPKSHPTQPKKPVWTNLEVPPDSVILLTGVSRKTDRSWYRADCTLGEESSIKPGGKFKILLSERQYARADAQQKAGKPVSLGLKTDRYPDGVEIDGEMIALEDLAADINVRKTDSLPKSPEEYRTATEQSFTGNEWVNFRFFPDLVALSKTIDPDTARTDYRADVTSEIAGRNCSFTLHLAKWQYDKAVKAQNQNSPIHIGMKLKYIKGGVIPVQFEDEQSTHNYSPKKLEESLPKVQKARSGSGCRQGKGNRVSSYQDRSYRFKTEEAYEHGLPEAHESRN